MGSGRVPFLVETLGGSVIVPFGSVLVRPPVSALEPALVVDAEIGPICRIQDVHIGV